MPCRSLPCEALTGKEHSHWRGTVTQLLLQANHSVARPLKVVFPRVECFRSGHGFLDAYTPDRPGCLVLDVLMPGMDGLQLQQYLIQQGIQLPIVFLTGRADVKMAVQAMQAGAVDFLQKPCPEQQLWESIRRALAQDERDRRHAARRQPIRDRLNSLSANERTVLDLVYEGLTNKQIAQRLDLSARTIEDRRGRVMKKMEAESVAELIRMVLEVLEAES